MEKKGIPGFILRLSISCALVGVGLLLVGARSAPAAAPASAASSTSVAPEVKLVMASSATGSTGHLKVSLIANAISKATSGKIKVSVIPTSGTPDSVVRLQNGEVDVQCAATVVFLYDNIRRAGPGGKLPALQTYAVFPIGLSPLQTVMLADSPVRTWADLAGKRIAGGTPGSNGAASSKMFLEVAGLTNKVDLTFLSFAAAIDALKDKKIDLSMMSTGAPNPLVMELQTRNPIRLLDYTPQMLQKMADMFEGGANLWTLIPITKAVYPNLVKDSPQATVIQIATVRKEMPDNLAYWLAKTYWESLPELKKSNAAFLEHNAGVIQAVPQQYVPWHPGALKYYKEQGILK